MTETNTIANLDNISSLAYNDVFAIDDLNDLDIFGAPITKNVSALQISNYINRSFGAATFIANCDMAQITNLTATYSNGTAGVGATLTNAGAQAALSVDGVTAVVGYRILVGGQTSAFQNGIYEVTTVGTGATNWVLTRATDYDTASEILLGTFTSIQRGSTLIGRSYIQANTSITVGTTSIVFQSLQSTLMSAAASLAIGGTGGNFFLGAGGGVLTLPSGTKTIAAYGEAATFSTVTSTAGNGSGTYKSAGAISVQTTPVGNITTGEDDLMSYGIPADSLSAAGKSVRITAWGTGANNANVKTVKTYINAGLINSATLLANAAGVWKSTTIISCTGTDTQSYFSEFTRLSATSTDVSVRTQGTGAVDDGATITIKFTGEATATDDITQNGMIVEFMN